MDLIDDLARLITRLGNAVNDTSRTSRLAVVLQTLTHYIRHSYGYR